MPSRRLPENPPPSNDFDSMTVAGVIRALERLYPPFLHSAEDPPPFAAGDPDAPVHRLRVALDADPWTVTCARDDQVDFLLVHHPPFYRAPKTLHTGTEAGRLARLFVESNMAIYALHLAFDQALGGTSDALASCLNISEPDILHPTAQEPFLKMVAFVPTSHKEAVREALANAGAGQIGNYSGCTFTTPGEGTFRPEEGAHPFIGQPGEIAHVEEWSIEILVPEHDAARVEQILRDVHPYEEPGFDWFPVRFTRAYGLGRVGLLAESETLEALARRAARITQSEPVIYEGDPLRPIQRVAVWPGAGFPAALADASVMDVVVTGELGYHDRQSVLNAGVGVITLGHAESEWPAIPGWVTRLSAVLPGVELSVAQRPPKSRRCIIP